LEQHQKQNSIFEITLTPNNTKRLAALRGELDGNLRLIEKRLEVNIYSRDNHFTVKGHEHKPQIATRVLKSLYDETAASSEINSENVHLHLRQFESDKSILKGQIKDSFSNILSVIRTKKGNIKPRGVNQNKYIQHIYTHDVNFGIGPAGTGKTYLAVACAVDALLKNQVERILLVRPAVEAGEKLGFLPGDLAQKVDPYLRPLYDALYEMLGHQTVIKLIERNTIEIAPLAYMRGRTLNNAFIILDEAQNTTREQMKMFLTRIGFGSTAIVTGDVSQIDLPKGVISGLKHAQKILKGLSDISFTTFSSKDVVRHPIVQKIVEAYDTVEKTEE
jgi:phosphate starvation-inducible PhoH-like protein